MGSVGSSSSVDGSLSGDVGDFASLWVKRLGLSVGFEVLEESKNMSASLFWESTVVMVVVLAHGVSSWSSSKSSERNEGFVFNNIVKVFDSFQ